jgi:hypothetical protein
MDTDSNLKFRLALLIKSVKKLAALNLISEDLSEEFPEEFEKDEYDYRLTFPLMALWICRRLT